MTRVSVHLRPHGLRAAWWTFFLVVTLAFAPALRAQDADAPVNPPTQPCEPRDTCGETPPPDPPVVSTVLRTAAVAAIPMVILHAAAIAIGASATTALMIATLKSSQNADGGSCLAMLCLASPFQGALLVGATAMGLAAGAVTSWIFSEKVTKKRVALLPPWLLMHLPAVPLLGVAAVAQWLMGWSGICCATCGGLCFASFLVSAYDWPNQNAEYYALRRVGPPIFFCCFFSAQAVASSLSLGGGALGALIAGVWAAKTGRMMFPSESGPYLDMLTVPGELDTPADDEDPTTEWVLEGEEEDLQE